MSVPASEPANGHAEPWQRVHPVSPLVRGWLAVVAIAFVYGQNTLSSSFGGEGPYPGEEFVDGGSLLVPVLIGSGILVLILLGFLGSWWFTKYQITDRHVNVNSGMIFRQQRQARIDRVQSIDIAQPLVARIFGLAELRFDVADSGSAAMSLSYIKLSEAHQLRNTILARAAGLKAAEAPQQSRTPGPEQGEPSEHGAGADRGVHAPDSAAAQLQAASEYVVATVPVGRLVGSLLLRPVTMFVVLGLAGLAYSMSAFDGFNPVYLIPAFLGLGGVLWNHINTGYNFKAATSADGLRLSYGLLDTRHQTVPPGRVQAIKVSAPFFWRRFGWYKVAVNVAGVGGAGAEDSAERSVLLPVGTYEDVLAVLSVVLPDPGTPAAREFFAAAINGSGDGHGFIVSPRRVRPLSPLAHRRQGYAVTDTALVARSGAFHRTTAIVPHERTQGIRLYQGPLARRFGVAELQLATIAGPVAPVVHQMDLDEARALFLAQSDRAAVARKKKDTNHWLEEA
ncbi:PH domain-containing protein [Paeniglutamicibacter kerguelensis]|uniref:Membrane protein n=1 Tax=Paeniglutamicibacter kerguelensis TaxID=254788 RepID=A0ABS4XIN7_9MICC|nr:putative membrane protein [Paeniglutamicibacter kerguelensis]